MKNLHQFIVGVLLIGFSSISLGNSCSNSCPSGVKEVTFCDVTHLGLKVYNGFLIRTSQNNTNNLYFDTSNLNFYKKSLCTNAFRDQMGKFKDGTANCSNSPKPGVAVNFEFRQKPNCTCTRVINTCGV